MKDKLKAFVGEKRGVSPVIGVVLMVAVVVILAAVIGAFVLGLGGDQQTTPQASFSYDAANTQLTMSSGDAIDAGNLYYVADDGARTGWAGDTSGTTNNDNAVVSGDSATVDATNTIKVIYDDGNGNTATLTNINVGNAGNGGA